MQKYVKLMEFLGVPPFLVIAEYAMASQCSPTEFDIGMGFEWLDNRLSDLINNEAEEEMLVVGDPSPFSPPSVPINQYLERLQSNQQEFDNYIDWIEALNKVFHSYYSYLPFPDNFDNYDPFYKTEVRLLNVNTMILEIEDGNDVAQFRGAYEYLPF